MTALEFLCNLVININKLKCNDNLCSGWHNRSKEMRNEWYKLVDNIMGDKKLRVLIFDSITL